MKVNYTLAVWYNCFANQRDVLLIIGVIMRLTDSDIKQIIEECRAVLDKCRLSEEEAEGFIRNASDILGFYRDFLGEDCNIRYRVRKRSGRAELRFGIKGEKHDPFEEGREAERLSQQRSVKRVLFDQDAALTYRFASGYNIVTVRSGRKSESRNLLKQPMIQAVIGGLAAGLICLQLPEAANRFIIDEITAPVLSVSLDVLTGLLGPVVFLSIVRAVSALDSLDEFTGLGSKVLKRFLVTTLCVTVFSDILGMVFFPLFGKGTIAFDPGKLIQISLDIIPTNLFTPFIENNIPQIVILGIGMGAILLLLGDRAKGLSDLLSQAFEWVAGLMDSIKVIIPVVPFLSVFNIVARGDTAIFLRGWKYIVATYICMALCVTFKIFKVHRKCGIDIPVLWSGIKPFVSDGLMTGSASAPDSKIKEISEKELGINPEFSAFWIPMSNGMLDPTLTISLVLAPFLVADITGTPVSISFMLILMLLAVELSMASPGLTAGYTVIFQSLGMSAEYVGMFSAFSIVIKNCAAACGAAYKILEEIEAAYVTDNIDISYLSNKKVQTT